MQNLTFIARVANIDEIKLHNKTRRRRRKQCCHIFITKSKTYWLAYIVYRNNKNIALALNSRGNQIANGLHFYVSVAIIAHQKLIDSHVIAQETIYCSSTCNWTASSHDFSCTFL